MRESRGENFGGRNDAERNSAEIECVIRYECAPVRES